MLLLVIHAHTISTKVLTIHICFRIKTINAITGNINEYIFQAATAVKSAMINFKYLYNPTLYVGLLNKHLHLITCIEDLAIT